MMPMGQSGPTSASVPGFRIPAFSTAICPVSNVFTRCVLRCIVNAKYGESHLLYRVA